MIVLHQSLTEDLVEFPDPSSITDRPLYRLDVDPAKVNLERPLGVYRFKAPIRCGLKNCHQPHGKGLVVRTSDGYETNIGHICGTSHFGETFEAYWQVAARFETRKAHLNAIRDVKAIGIRLQEELAELMEAPRGAAWCSRSRRKFEATVPHDAMQALLEMARRGETEVFEESRASDEHKNLLRQLGARGSFGRSSGEMLRESRGHLAGMKIWAADPGKALYDLRKQLDEFLTIDALNCSRKQLRDASDFAVMFGGRRREIENLVEAGQRFFAPKTFQRLRFLDVKESTATVLSMLDWDYDAAQPRRSRAA